MSKDMKLIMESWRKNVIQEDPRDQAEIQTVGQLKQAIKGAVQAKNQYINEQIMLLARD